MLKENVVGHILYTKEIDGKPEVTERFIVPTTIPKSNIKAIDVSEMNDEQREILVEYHKEYQEYYKAQIKRIFSFEDWIDATYPNSIFSELISFREESRAEIKHRTFKIDNIQLV